MARKAQGGRKGEMKVEFQIGTLEQDFLDLCVAFVPS